MTWNWTWLGLAAMGFLALSVCVGFRRGFVREVAATFFLVLSLVSAWFINPYVNDFLRENTPVYETVQEGFSNLIKTENQGDEPSKKSEQNKFIEGLELPRFLKDAMEENNTARTYTYLAAESFGEYVSGYLAEAVVNGLSFVISYILAALIIRVLTFALDILARLPVIHGVNRIAGALVGGLKSVLVIWIALLVLAIFCNTEFGKKGMELVENDSFLQMLSQENAIAGIFMDVG